VFEEKFLELGTELFSKCVGLFGTEEVISMDDVKWKKDECLCCVSLHNCACVSETHA